MSTAEQRTSRDTHIGSSFPKCWRNGFSAGAALGMALATALNPVQSYEALAAPTTEAGAGPISAPSTTTAPTVSATASPIPPMAQATLTPTPGVAATTSPAVAT